MTVLKIVVSVVVAFGFGSVLVLMAAGYLLGRCELRSRDGL